MHALTQSAWADSSLSFWAAATSVLHTDRLRQQPGVQPRLVVVFLTVTFQLLLLSGLAPVRTHFLTSLPNLYRAAKAWPHN